MRLSAKIANGTGAVLLFGAGALAWSIRTGPLPACETRTYSDESIAAVRALERPATPDSVTNASLSAKATPEDVWDIVEHFETAWPASNDAHVQTCVVTPPETVHEGMIYHDVERVAGLPAIMYAHVYDVVPARQFRWKAIARYDLGLFELPIRQGGTFRIQPATEGVEIAHEVWADFPDDTSGHVAEWFARTFLAMEESAIAHNRVELEYFRDRAEAKER